MAAEEMFAKRQPGQVGNPLANCHPPKALKNVEWVIQQLRSGKTDAIRVHVPMHGPIPMCIIIKRCMMIMEITRN